MINLEDELGDVMAKARVGKGYTLDQLAAATGIQPSDLDGVEHYRLFPDRESLAKLAQALSLDPDKLADISEHNWTPHEPDLSPNSADVKRFVVPLGSFSENCYAIVCRNRRAAAVVDPGGLADEILRWLEDEGLSLEMVMVTHAHQDHVAGLKRLVADHPRTKLVNHQLERDSIVRNTSNPWEPAKDKVAITLGNLTVTPLYTPGHTPGSVCYLVDSACCVGDTLFAGSIGRPTNTQAYEQMLASIRSKLLTLPGNTVLLPGHGPATTVDQEKAHNPFF